MAAPLPVAEEEGAGPATAALDLLSAAILLALGLGFAGLSLALPVPDGWRSAPGLLPFLVSASLAVMALMLAMSAWPRRGRGGAIPVLLDAERAGRATVLVATLTYVGALDMLSLEGFVPILGAQIPMGGFEPCTILLLTVLLRIFWTERLWACLAVAAGWTLTLSLSFRVLFGIPLPG
ncbi:tripartite tricarboxylate transporter TctB family protein [Jannaschia aquimarina]|uniref:Tripartite tricarboxylate transporter TctB family protein n=1 Tax=Jannaschia aquimarina TaxID=935700 RepID=A0A0D1EIX2_9RHOB|nr:tripartite tricarboxylate transporter TctB family protein [Jannaschia aquimarina]KIT17584.1 Tripartite tricarboxylate transporter TctB family protein [Jannaschia aquimarina]SNS72182.1 Tripartite tricarboxylate transporter TctB family protein [Jannaschia aquimarina]